MSPVSVSRIWKNNGAKSKLGNNLKTQSMPILGPTFKTNCSCLCSLCHTDKNKKTYRTNPSPGEIKWNLYWPSSIENRSIWAFPQTKLVIGLSLAVLNSKKSSSRNMIVLRMLNLLKLIMLSIRLQNRDSCQLLAWILRQCGAITYGP